MGEDTLPSQELRRLQNRYLAAGAFVLPFTPFLYLQGQYTRYRVGRLPDAVGRPSGEFVKNGSRVRLLALGESTVAGVGVERIEDALGARFAYHLSALTERSVEWHAAGVSGITVRRTIREVLPALPAVQFDVILIALGGNDVFALNSPAVFRRDMKELIGTLREANENAEFFLANVPMVRDAIALPHPLKFVLAKLAKMQHFNTIDLVSGMDRVHYFDEVKRVGDEFFSDGIHPSKTGYDAWASEMAECFIRRSGFDA